MSEPASQKVAPWRECTLADVAFVVGGGTPSRAVPKFWNGSIPWATPGDITSCQTNTLITTKEHISQSGLRASAAKPVPPGSVLMTSRATVGECRLAGTWVCTNQGFKNLVPKEGVDGRFLMYQMQFRRHQYENLGIGTTFLEVSKKDTENFVLHLPPTSDEQRRIADLLSAVDEQIQLLDAEAAKESMRALALLQALLPAGFAVENPPKNRLMDALWGIEAGKSFMCSDMPAPEGAWGVLKVSAVRPEGFVSSENKQVEDLSLVNPQYEVAGGDLLMTRANTPELVGAACYVVAPQRRLLLCDKTLRLRPKPEVLPQYLWLWLQTPVARRHVEAHATGTSAGMKNISQAAIRSLPLTMPAPDKQAALVRPIAALYEHIRYLRTSSSKMRKLKSGLSARLLIPGAIQDK